jgi:L-asparaginase
MKSPCDSILVLTTGGTIDKQYFDSLSQYQIIDSIVTKLLNVAQVFHPYRVEQLLRKDSINLTDIDRQCIADRVRVADHSRIVITHGTDTITTTAAVLLTILDKTIVLTGALAPARFIESDAAFNLGMAFAAAQVAGAGVYIAMNGSIFHASKVMKDRERGRFVQKDVE